jgi:chromosome segregation ATPase
MELLQRRHQIENLQKDMEEKQSALDSVLLERDRAEAEKEKHSISYAKASETPIKIVKQIEVLKDAITALQGEHAKQVTIIQSLDKEIERLGRKKKDLEEHRLSQSAAYEERRGLISQMERQVDDIFKEHELAKEQLAFQKAERVRLELAMRKVTNEIKREHDLVLRVIREKDTYLKYYRRLELTVNNIKMSTPTTIKQGEELRRQLKAIKADEVFYRKEVVNLRQTIDINTLEFLKHDKIEKMDMETLEEQRETNLKCEMELEDALKEAAEVSRAVEDLKIEKDMKLREVIRSGSKLRIIKNDNITQDIAVVDASKRCQETATRVKEFMSLYELVKNEKNKYVSPH